MFHTKRRRSLLLLSSQETPRQKKRRKSILENPVHGKDTSANCIAPHTVISPGAIYVTTIHPGVIDVDATDGNIITETIEDTTTNNCAPPTIIYGDPTVNTNPICPPRLIHYDTITTTTEITQPMIVLLLAQFLLMEFHPF